MNCAKKGCAIDSIWKNKMYFQKFLIFKEKLQKEQIKSIRIYNYLDDLVPCKLFKTYSSLNLRNNFSSIHIIITNDACKF